MEALRKVFRFMLNLLIFFVTILLLFALYNFIQIKILGKDYVNYFGYTFFEVQTGSMEDTIYVNDFVFVKLDESFSEDDIITFYYNDSIVTHRIVELKENELITKGDANNTLDNPITYNDVIGKVVFIGHEYGTYIRVFRNPVVLGLIIAVVILLSILLDDKWKGVKVSNEEKE